MRVAMEALRQDINTISLRCAPVPALQYIDRAVDKDLQDAQTQYKHDGRLGLLGHLDIPDHENW